MDPASKPALGDPLKSFPSLRRYFVNMRHSGRHLQRTLVLTDFRSQLIAAFGSATGTQATEFLVLHNATALLDDLIQHSGRSSMSSTMRLLVGVTRHVRWIEAKSWEEYRGVTGEVSEWSIMN